MKFFYKRLLTCTKHVYRCVCVRVCVCKSVCLFVCERFPALTRLSKHGVDFALRLEYSRPRGVARHSLLPAEHCEIVRGQTRFLRKGCCNFGCMRTTS